MAKKVASKHKVLVSLEDHLVWSLPRRGDVQTETFRLYRLMGISTTNAIGRRRRVLAGVAFSLWRAVFLAHRTGATEQKNAEAKAFLQKILTSNAITFGDDRVTQEWTFRFYMDSARLRLEELQKHWPTIQIKMWSKSEQQFDGLLFAFKHAITQLEMEMGIPEKVKPAEKP